MDHSKLVATYRLQLTPAFNFDAVTQIVDYLAELGVSHLYLSPIFEARPGSLHGYDQTDPTRIRAELGGEPAFERLVGAAHQAGLGVLLDIVPNHMAAHHANPWWFDLLKHGEKSRHNRFFDVDWPSGGGRIVLPVLGLPIAEAIARGELSVKSDPAAGSELHYVDKVFPLRPDVPLPPLPLTNAAFTNLLAQQHYELAFWRDGLKRINYRRFFDIADLAGVRAEDPVVFEQTHAKVFELVARKYVDAVRVDHIDGLADPLQYLRRLRQGLDQASSSESFIPIFVEKILARGESPPASWPVDGATGYEFLATSTALMADPQGLVELRARAVASGAGVPDVVALADRCKREVAEGVLAPELDRLCRKAEGALEAANLPCTKAHVRQAVVNISAALRVYRTYADEIGISPEDSERIRVAAQTSGSAASTDGQHVFKMLTLADPFHAGALRAMALQVLKAWQQFTGPLAAKGVEDTALYRDIACVACNDVGSEPTASDPAILLGDIAEQRALRPLALNATDTHDAKRSEDVRARLAVLSSVPEAWQQLLEDLLARLQSSVPGVSPADRSLLAHSAFALWPIARSPADVSRRLKAYIVKAAREAKQATSWTEPNKLYERACEQAVDALLLHEAFADARAKLAALAQATRPTAARRSIAAIALKTLFPGTPDWYQGTECQALSLVDPDNRREIDFDAHRKLLRTIHSRWRVDRQAATKSFLTNPDSDVAKLFVSWRLLALRRQLLASGSITLDVFEMSPSQWLWGVSAGDNRCVITVDVSCPSGVATPNAAGSSWLQIVLNNVDFLIECFAEGERP